MRPNKGIEQYSATQGCLDAHAMRSVNEMNERNSRIAVNLGSGLSAWYMLISAIWVACGMAGILKRGGYAGLISLITMVGSFLAFPIILVGLKVLLVDSIQFPRKRMHITLLVGGMIVTGLLIAVFVFGAILFGL